VPAQRCEHVTVSPCASDPAPGGGRECIAGDEMRPAAALARLAFNIGAPVVLFYLLRSQGVSDFAALAAGAALPALGACYTLVV
jgi:hypothetical protein